ncbi:MAG: PaaI family thioesterase [Myxococcota bacterium]
MADVEFVRGLGIETVLSEDGRCEMALEVEERHFSTAERVHGGVFFTLLDTAMGRAVISKLPEGRGCATIEAKINFFRPVQTGRLVAVGRCVNLSKRLAYTEAELVDAEGRSIAKASGTFMLTDTYRQADRERV